MQCRECGGTIAHKHPSRPGRQATFCTTTCATRWRKRSQRLRHGRLNDVADDVLAALPHRDLIALGVQL